MEIEYEDIYVRAARIGFVDPVTGLPPGDERTISALICIFHLHNRIDWEKVDLLDTKCQTTGSKASEIFSVPGALCSEYPLFWASTEDCNAFGEMRPDYLYIARDLSLTAILENKFGAGDTHAGDGYGGQFGRYIKYLKQSSSKHKYMVVISSRFYLEKEPPWYASELSLAEGIQSSSVNIKSRIIRIEDILDAFSR